MTTYPTDPVDLTGASAPASETAGVNGARLRSIIERIERLEEEKKGLTADIADVYQEAKGAGYDTKVIRQVIKLRAMDPTERGELEELTDLYLASLGQ